MKSWVLPSRSCSFVALAHRKKDESVFSSIKQVSGLRVITMCELGFPKKPPDSCHVDVELVGFTCDKCWWKLVIVQSGHVNIQHSILITTSMIIKLDKIVEINPKQAENKRPLSVRIYPKCSCKRQNSGFACMYKKKEKCGLIRQHVTGYIQT